MKARNLMTIIAMLYVFISISSAHAGGYSNGNNGNQGGDTSSQASSSSSASAGAVAVNVNDVKSSSSVKINNDSQTKQSNYQKSGDVSVTDNSSYQDTKQIAVVSAPSLTTGTCMGSVSAGFGNDIFGASFGSTVNDDQCQLRYNSIRLSQMGQDEAAALIMCDIPAVKASLEKTGFDCKDGNDSSPAKLPKTTYTSSSHIGNGIGIGR